MAVDWSTLRVQVLIDTKIEDGEYSFYDRCMSNMKSATHYEKAMDAMYIDSIEVPRLVPTFAETSVEVPISSTFKHQSIIFSRHWSSSGLRLVYVSDVRLSLSIKIRALSANSTTTFSSVATNDELTGIVACGDDNSVDL